MRSQAGAWERGKRGKPHILVPKPLLGNALAGEVPRLPATEDPKPGLRAQMRSQAGAWERGKIT